VFRALLGFILVLSTCSPTLHAAQWSGSAEQDICAICTEKIGSQQQALPCGHKFDEQCIQQWLDIKKRCPLCQYNLSTLSPAQMAQFYTAFSHYLKAEIALHHTGQFKLEENVRQHVQAYLETKATLEGLMQDASDLQQTEIQECLNALEATQAQLVSGDYIPPLDCCDCLMGFVVKPVAYALAAGFAVQQCLNWYTHQD
jgi:hypothetical protein